MRLVRERRRARPGDRRDDGAGDAAGAGAARGDPRPRRLAADPAQPGRDVGELLRPRARLAPRRASRRWSSPRRRQADAFITILAPTNTRALAGVDPTRIARAARARRPIQEARLASRWCGTLWPTPAGAQDARMSDGDYAEFVTRALFLDRPEPIGAWQQLSDSQAALAERLAAGARDPNRGRGHRPAAARRRPDLDQLRRQAQHAQRRGFHRADRRLCAGHGPLRSALEPARRGGLRHFADVRAGPRDPGARRSAATTTCKRHSRPTPARATSASWGSAPTSASIEPPARSCSTRRWQAPCTWPWGGPIPRPAAANDSALHWDMICDLRDGGRLTVDGEPIALTSG